MAAVGVDVGGGVAVLVGEANGAVGLAGAVVSGISVGVAVALAVAVGVIAVAVGEANGAVGLTGASVGIGGAGVGGASVGVAVALAVAVAAVVGVTDALTVGDGVACVTGGGRVDVGSSTPVHPASTMTTRSQHRKVSL